MAGSRQRHCRESIPRYHDLPADAPAWNDFHLSTEAYRREIEKLEKHDAAEAVRLFYRMYAFAFRQAEMGRQDSAELSLHA
jgi:hypothetical protein